MRNYKSSVSLTFISFLQVHSDIQVKKFWQFNLSNQADPVCKDFLNYSKKVFIYHMSQVSLNEQEEDNSI
jgi:hypothetical protein